jgi:hypothetical protein
MKSRFNQQLKRVVAGGFFASLLCSPAMVGAAPEVEPNGTQVDAQALAISPDGGASVTARLGTAGEATTDDIDIYAFDGKAGDVPVITLNANGSFDAILYFYDSVGNLLDSNDDAYPPTEGSACITDFTVACDPRIDLQPLSADGRYYIAVGPGMRFMWTNYEVHPSFLAPQPGGAYELSLMGVTPPPSDDGSAGGDAGDSGGTDDTAGTDTSEPDVMTVMITTLHSHKHGKHGRKYDDDAELGIYNGWKAIPVAIHSMEGFNAVKDVDLKSLTFGATGDEDSFLMCLRKGKRVKLEGVRDHERDLVCFFRPDRANLVEGDMSATLKGRTMDGKEIAGSGILRVFRLPTQRTLNWYERHDLNPRAVKPKKVKKHKHNHRKKNRKDR